MSLRGGPGTAFLPVQAGCAEAAEPQGSPMTALLLAALQANPAHHPDHLRSPAHPRSAPPAAPAPDPAPGSGRGASAGRAACAGAAQLPSPFNTPNLLSLPLPGAFPDARVSRTRPGQTRSNASARIGRRARRRLIAALGKARRCATYRTCNQLLNIHAMHCPHDVTWSPCRPVQM